MKRNDDLCTYDILKVPDNVKYKQRVNFLVRCCACTTDDIWALLSHKDENER